MASRTRGLMAPQDQQRLPDTRQAGAKPRVHDDDCYPARREESWGKLEKAFNANEKVQGVIFNQVKGGFTVDLDGAVAFLPRSQVDIRPIRDVSPLMNQPQPFQILKMDRRRGNIVVSRRAVLE